MVSATQKENALMLFHLMGKMMYNKRPFAASISHILTNSIITGKGDPHARSASAKDIARDRALDRSLEDPPPLPPWLAAEERRTSRVDVDVRDFSHDADSTGLSDHLVPCRCCMRPPRSMRPFSGSIFTKIIHNTVLALNNVAP
jgi:cell cycle checkpoint protein